MHQADRTLDAVERLRAARADVPAVETEHALARLQSALFGGPAHRLVLDRYPLIRKLGQGGSGIVYLAYDPRLDRKVAIKVLGASGNAVHGTSEGRARLLREAQAMARSPHPNVIAVYDVGTVPVGDDAEPSVYLVMEYAEGPDLRQWLQRARPWREVLDVFVAAGRGLSAAHRVGVIHRDFKPANAIVGDDGRVRVLDFGLARGAGRDEDDTANFEVSGTHEPISELDSPLTAEGTVLGTPAFMPPEQHLHAMSDAAGDQFSFCVALWEGLHRERPFVGSSLEGLLKAKLSRTPVPPEGTSVPRWLSEILRRGMHPDPEQRWPGMDALLGAIEHRLARMRRRRGLWGFAALAPLLVGAWSLGASDTEACSGGDDRVRSFWNEGRRAEIEATFHATGLPFAAETTRRVDDHVARFGRAWALEHRDACEATNVRQEQSDDLMDLRMRCLERQRAEVDALLELFETADGPTVERAGSAVFALPRPETCGNVDALLAEVAPPADPTTGAAVEELRDEVARVKALERTGRIPDALALGRTLAARAEDLGYAPLVAETTSLLGALESRNGHDDDAVRTLARGHAAALACGHDKQAARAAQELVFVHGDRRGELELAMQWAEIAEAELVRAELEEERPALLAAKASAQRTAGQFQAAAQSNREAIELLERISPDDAPALASLYNNQGDVFRELGEHDAAREQLELAHRMWERALGPEHPDVAVSLNNLGNLELAVGDPAHAQERYLEALAIRERALGPRHPLVATTLSNLGIALRRNERYDEAHQAYARGLAILRAEERPSDARVAKLLNGLGLVEVAQGRYADALAHFDEALALSEVALPPEHPDIARTLQNRAEMQLRIGEHAAATSSFMRSLALKERAYGAGHPKVAIARFDYAAVLKDTGATAEATRLAREALAGLDPGADADLKREIEDWLATASERYPAPSDPRSGSGLRAAARVAK